METVILGWYVMVQTGSVLLLTAFGSLLLLGTLASPMFGVLGDRLGGRAVLSAMRAVYAVLAAFVLLLTLTGSLTPGWARVIAALAGAELSTLLGIERTYVLVTTLYAASFVLTWEVARRRPVPDPGGSIGESSVGATGAALVPSHRRELKDGLLYVLRTPELLAMMWLAFLINLTAYPISSGLLPYVAKRVFLVDATGLGWLAASFALGSLMGSIATVATGGPRRLARSMLVYTAIWYAILLAFGHLQSMGPGLFALVVAGFVQSIAMIAMTANLLNASDERFRARVMGVRTLAIYGMPLGLMASGGLIERIGYPSTISVFAAVGLVFTLLIGIRWRASLWQRRRRPTATA